VARTFTEQARRAQIVAAAVDTIADLGYGQASFARIARRAGLSSTGLISYHFASKSDLMNQVAQDTFEAISAHMAARMAGAPTPAAALETYIRGSAEFVAGHRRQMKAVLEIFMNGGVRYEPGTELVVLSPVEEILRAGQKAGEFRDFDPRVMAAVIQRAIDGLPFLLETHPDVDLGAYADELATTFALATRRAEAPQRASKPDPADVPTADAPRGRSAS
jgi:AcrR family transcriptional regulator